MTLSGARGEHVCCGAQLGWATYPYTHSSRSWQSGGDLQRAEQMAIGAAKVNHIIRAVTATGSSAQ